MCKDSTATAGGFPIMESPLPESVENPTLRSVENPTLKNATAFPNLDSQVLLVELSLSSP
jgi:hypothetical protein